MFNFKRKEFMGLEEIPGLVVRISTSARRYNAFPKVIRVGHEQAREGGALLATWYSGNAHVDTNGDGQIWGAFSHDEARTWTEPFLIHDDPSLDCRNMSMVKARDGTLAILFAKVKVVGRVLQWQKFGVITSADDGLTWSPFLPIVAQDPSVDHLVSKGNGYGDAVEVDNKLLVLCYSRYEIPHEPIYDAWLAESRDNGHTWSFVNTINNNPSIPTNEADFWLAKAEKTNEQVLFGFVRTRPITKDILHYFESNDKGETWSPLVATNAWGHSPDLMRLQDGRYIVAYRAKTKRGNFFIGYFLLDKEFPFLSWELKKDLLKNLQQKCLVRTSFNQRAGDMAYQSLVPIGSDKILVVYYDIDAGGVFSKIIRVNEL